jgi:hypothetical protein
LKAIHIVLFEGKPDLTRCDVRRTLAPLSIRYFNVGTAARMRVSSVILRSASRGTFRSARTSTLLPSKSALLKSPTDFFFASVTRRVRLDRDREFTVADSDWETVKRGALVLLEAKPC